MRNSSFSGSVSLGSEDDDDFDTEVFAVELEVEAQGTEARGTEELERLERACLFARCCSRIRW